MDNNTKKILIHLLDKVDPEWKQNQELSSCFKSNRFTPPSITEIHSYLSAQNVRNPKDCAEKFYNFYESKGWMVGKNKMKDWKSAIKTWKFEKNNLIL